MHELTERELIEAERELSELLSQVRKRLDYIYATKRKYAPVTVVSKSKKTENLIPLGI